MLQLKPFDPSVSEKRLQRFLQSNSLEALSRCLHMDPEVMERTLTSERNYHIFPIPKKTGGKRIIHAPARPLRDIQERLNYFLNRMYGNYAPDYVHGFVKSSSGNSAKNIITNASEHIGRPWVLNIDIEDFFPSITAAQIRTVLLESPVCFKTKEAASILALLTTNNWKLPAGSPCSPVLSNMVFYKTDQQLKSLADRRELAYTRYADDLSFSSKKLEFSQEISDEITKILEADGYKVNKRKIRLQTKHGSQYVTGLKVNQKLNVDRRYVRRIRAILHHWEREGIEKASERFFASKLHIFRNQESMQLAFINSVGGRIGFLCSVKQQDPVVCKLFDRFSRLKKT
jgi:RNA-directed DNA polymerase